MMVLKEALVHILLDRNKKTLLYVLQYINSTTATIHNITTPNKHTGEPDTINETNETNDMPYDIHMSQDPFDNIQQIEITVEGDHLTLGMQLDA